MDRRHRLTLLATIIGSGIVIVDGTIVNLALPKIGADLHAGFSDLQWIADGFLLTLSALILVGGSLGDIFGRKKMYVIGVLGFGAASLLCGLSPNAASLVIARLLQGAFGALLVPGGLAIINTNFPRHKRGAAIGSWSAWLAIFAPLGPIVGGYLLDVTSWRWIFLINPPFALLCAYLAQQNFTESRDEDHRRLDVAGGTLAVAALASMTYGLIEGPTSHWSLTTVLFLAVGLLCAGMFLWVERRTKDPVVPPALFRSRTFTGSNLMTFMTYGALGGFLFAFVIYLQTALGYSSIMAGIATLPLPAALFLFSKRFGALSVRKGPRLFMTAGPLLVAAGILSLYGVHAGAGYAARILPGIVLFGLGMSLLVAPLTVTVMGSVADSSSGIASGINNAVARVSGLVVIAMLGIAGLHYYYNFAIILCGCMAVLAGLISWLYIPKSGQSVSAEANVAVR